MESNGFHRKHTTNIAARLESLAGPAGICISKKAFEQIETKLPLGYEYLGNSFFIQLLGEPPRKEVYQCPSS
jgi:class 3 adenylate cyclase